MPTSNYPVQAFPAYLALGDGEGGAAEDVSIYFNNIEPAVDSDEVVGDTFTRRYRIQADPARSLSLTGYWSSEADEKLAPIEGKTGVKYEWGPEGKVAGGVLWTGECNVGYIIGPAGGVDDLWTFTLDLKLVTKVKGTYPVTP